MTIRELQGDFQLEIQNYDQPGILPSDIIFYWLNEALIKFVNIHYDNDKTSFEETQNVTDILKNLVKEVGIDPTTPVNTFGLQVVEAILPDDYMHALNERVTIEVTDPGNAGVTITKDSSITNAYSNTLNKQIADPYSPHKLHYESARPLRLFLQDRVNLYSDEDYAVTKYYLRYLSKPKVIALPSKTTPNEDFTDLPSNVHHDLVVLAAKMYAESVKGNDAPLRQKELMATKSQKIQTK